MDRENEQYTSVCEGDCESGDDLAIRRSNLVESKSENGLLFALQCG